MPVVVKGVGNLPLGRYWLIPGESFGKRLDFLKICGIVFVVQGFYFCRGGEVVQKGGNRGDCYQLLGFYLYVGVYRHILNGGEVACIVHQNGPKVVAWGGLFHIYVLSCEGVVIGGGTGGVIARGRGDALIVLGDL